MPQQAKTPGQLPDSFEEANKQLAAKISRFCLVALLIQCAVLCVVASVAGRAFDLPALICTCVIFSAVFYMLLIRFASQSARIVLSNVFADAESNRLSNGGDAVNSERNALASEGAKTSESAISFETAKTFETTKASDTAKTAKSANDFANASENVHPSADLSAIERDNRYANLVKNSNDAIIFHNLEGRITGWNLGAELLLGFNEFEMKGKNLNIILPEEHRKTYWSHVSELRNFPRLPAFEVQLSSRDKDLIYVSATIFEIAGTGRDTGTVSLTARDITRQREAEAHISELYGMVSHEMRTPLTSLRGSLTLLDEKMVEVDSDDGRTMLRIARQGADKLLKIVNDILDVRKLEAGRMKFHREVVKVDELINQSVLGMQKFADSRGVKLTIAVAEEAFVSADRERIIQVLINFLSNAVKHSTPGSEVQIQVVLRQSGNVRFSVVDSGPGIAPDQQATLFQKFHNLGHSQAPTSLTGAGLGLAICKSIVQQHEGTIGLISAEGSGSTFWFELKALGRTPRRPGGTMVVDAVKHTLLVSDNESVVQLMHHALTKSGIGCRLIERSEDAVPITESVKPNLVFLDANFVGANLLDVLQRINTSTPSARTIVYRSFADSEPGFSHPVSIQVYSDFDELKSRLHELTKRNDQTAIGFVGASELPPSSAGAPRSLSRSNGLSKSNGGTNEAADDMKKWITSADINELRGKVNGQQLAAVAADLEQLVHTKFAPLKGWPVEVGCTIALIRGDLTPADESFAILNIQGEVLSSALTESEFLEEIARRL